MEKEILIKYEQGKVSDLSKSDFDLVHQAIKFAKNAYAPYSKFHVGACLKLSNNERVGGSNQENVSFPTGLCAEKVAFSQASALYPNEKMEKVVIYAEALDYKISSVVSPCGNCRQFMAEYETKQGQDIEVILVANDDYVRVKSISDFLPLLFNEDNLKR